MQKENLICGAETANDSVHVVLSEQLGGAIAYTLSEGSVYTENLMVLTVAQAEELGNGLNDALMTEEALYHSK